MPKGAKVRLPSNAGAFCDEKVAILAIRHVKIVVNFLQMKIFLCGLGIQKVVTQYK